MLTEAAAEWLETRGLDVEMALRLGLASKRPPHARGGEWIAIPYVRDGRTVNTKYRWIDAPPNESKWRQIQGGEKTWWNGDVIRDRTLADEPLIITEGEWDALALIQCGFTRVVSVPEGAPPTSQAEDSAKYAFLKMDELRAVKHIVLAVDGDANGSVLLSDLSSILGPARCRWVAWPEYCKDANDVLVRRGQEGLRKAVESARWCDQPGLRTLADYPEFNAEQRVVWRANITPDFHDKAGFMPGFMSVVTGIPSHGKSTLMNAVTWELARQGIKPGIGSFEAPPNVEYSRDAGTYLLGRRPEGNGARPAWSPEERERVFQWVNENIVFLDPHESDGGEQVDATLRWFLDCAAAANIRYGARFFLLDPWSDIRQERMNGQSEHEFIQSALIDIKRFCRRFDSHVCVVAHPKKIESEGRGASKAYRRPGLYDISGSAHWYNQTSLGIVVHKEPRKDMDGKPVPNDTRTAVTIEKSKFHSFQGKPGTCWMQFYPSTGRYGPQ